MAATVQTAAGSRGALPGQGFAAINVSSKPRPMKWVILGIFLLCLGFLLGLWLGDRHWQAAPQTTRNTTTVVAMKETPENDQYVQSVRREPYIFETATDSAGVGDTIDIYVVGLREWITANNTRAHHLVPKIDGNELTGTYPILIQEQQPTKEGYRVVKLQYVLEFKPESSTAWLHLLHLGWKRNAEISLCIEGGKKMESHVTAASGSFKFSPMQWFQVLCGFVIVMIVLAIFLYLAHNTNILRDETAPLRPDRRLPYSLARAQMAFWLFIVVSAFLFLWIATGGGITAINAKVLALLGISAVTGFAAAAVDAPKGNSASPFENLPTVNLNQKRSKIARDLEAELDQLLQLVQAKKQEQATEPGCTNLSEDLVALEERAKTVEKQIGYFKVPAWRGVITDLLSEHGEVSFHRFQMMVWTLVLGLVFVHGVVTTFAMPDLDATLVGLMGIVGGTYIGFKLPATQLQTGATIAK